MPTSSPAAPPSDKSSEAPQPEFCGGTTGFLMMIMGMITIFIMFSPDLRESIAIGLDVVFDPLFGFDDKFPVITLLSTSIFLVFCSTTIRHFMTDWIGIARAQKIMSGIQKEKTDAMLSGNTVKLKKIEELNPELAKHQMVLMTSNLKPIAFTMIFFIIVFPWIWAVYMERLDYFYISLPGIAKWDLTTNMNICPGGFKYWILIYILLSFPIGFLIQNGWKYITFTRMLKHTEVKQQKDLDEEILKLEGRITELNSKGITVDKSKELLKSARENLSEKQYTSASKMITEAEEYLERKKQTNLRIKGLITEAESMIKNAKNKNIGVVEAEKSLDFAQKALNRNDETSAIYYAKQSQRKVKESREQHKKAEETLSSVKAFMYDLREIETEEADQIFNQAIKSMDEKDYSKVVKLSKATKVKAEEIKNLHKEASKLINSARNAMDTIKHLGLRVENAEKLYNKATVSFSEHKYQETLNLANQLIDLINSEKDKFQEAQESVSFAKLVISNAQSFGADVDDAAELVGEAETALTEKRYDHAIEVATKAKDMAEQAKRQQQRISKRR